ncbi:MAG: hypothetical protein JSS35_04340 [Proteobacteria bacterium]|nr:hypothetical protein [Pseudomonadota bacterium]
MRIPFALLASAVALLPLTPVLAQTSGAHVALQRDLDARTVAQMQAAKEHDTALKNDLSTLQASEQTRQVLNDIAGAGARPAIPTVPFNPKAPPPKLEADQFASIPDAALAASNARAVAAAGNRK